MKIKAIVTGKWNHKLQKFEKGKVYEIKDNIAKNMILNKFAVKADNVTNEKIDNEVKKIVDEVEDKSMKNNYSKKSIRKNKI